MSTMSTQEKIQNWIEWVDREIRGAYAGVEEAFESVVKYKDSSCDRQWAPLGDYLAAMARRDLWASVDRQISTETMKHFGDREGALNSVVIEQESQLLNNRFRQSSTHQVSNAAESYQAEAAARFVESGRQLLNHLARIREEDVVAV